MKEYISEIKEDYVVLMDSDHALNIDLMSVIKTHEQTGAEITFVTQKVGKDYTSKTPRMMVSSIAGKIMDIAMSSSYNDKHPELALNIFVMKTVHLRTIIEEADAYSLNSLTKMFLKNYKQSNYRVYCFDGYVASVSSFLDYYKHSMTLAKSEEARNSLLWKKEFPIFTRVHNSAPTVHTNTAVVENSIIADECVIEGTVINSVIFRGVHIGKGAVIRDSVLFHGTYVEDNAELNCIVTDKDVHITKGVKLSGNENMPFYIQKGRKV
jgi:glucose-1-phosphate adenylyltransferase